MRTLVRLLRSLPLLLLSPLLILIALLTLLFTDLVCRLRKPRRLPAEHRPSTAAASVVIPNWNGRDLLEKYLPSVVEAVGDNPDNEIIVVDNGSADGSPDFLRERFPDVRLLPLTENHGFGGGSNAGVQAARNDIVVLLNNDMRVERNFLVPLLSGFSDEKVFAVSCQIFFSDPNKFREETGLTQGWWSGGRLRVRHRIDDKVDRLFPCFYGGGGSCAFDRRKFLELGGFDALLGPFYLEDTDLGYMAWKRGWKILYQPASKVYHEHRGTIGKRFTPSQIQTVLQKNFILFTWKNIHSWQWLAAHFAFTLGGVLVSVVLGEALERATLSGLWGAFRRLPAATHSRCRAKSLAIINDTEAFRRPRGGYFRDRFEPLPAKPETLRVLFVSPYPICPPVHGGGVFMMQTAEELAKLTDLHLAVMVDHPHEISGHAPLLAACKTAEFHLRAPRAPKQLGSVTPFAVREFASDDFRWLIDRKLFLDQIDVLQLEYLTMGQYGGAFKRLACLLFEHDIYFQSIGRALRRTQGVLHRARTAYEYMRALRYELSLLPLFDRIQVCSRENAGYLVSFLPACRSRLDPDYRAGVDLSRYRFQPDNREPNTLLFLGSFRHEPNLDGLKWLIREVMPLVLARQPRARLVVVGSEPPARHSLPDLADALELRGFVEDVREPLSRYALFVCPVLTGSGVRVKLLEAFAAGIPVVSTWLGAEGLASADGEICALADQPAAFAEKIVHLFGDPDLAAAMARRARTEVEAHRDIAELTRRMAARYREVITFKRQ